MQPVVDGVMTFPMTLGGFNGDTIIQKIAVDGTVYDTNNGTYSMVIAGISSDLELVSATNTNFIMFLNPGGNQWLWKKQFGCPGSPQDVKSLAIMSDKVAVLTSSTQLYVFETTAGGLLREHVESPPVTTCNPACEIAFRGGMLYLFATSITSPKKLYTARFDPSVPAGTTIDYKVWSAAPAEIEFMDADNGYWQIFISVRYGTTQSAILNVDPTLTTLHWSYRI